MKLKEKIIQDFLADNIRNFTLYGLDYKKMSDMYDKVVASIKAGENFDRFLNFEGAITSDGKIRYDKQVTYFDKELKQNIVTKIVFKYPVYQYIKNKYNDGMNAIRERELESTKALIGQNF